MTDQSWRLVHTGVFATRAEVDDASRPVHFAAFASGMEKMPVDRATDLCRAYGLPNRAEPGARFAIDTKSCELLYALPGGSS